MGQAEIISLSEVRARKQWAALRHQLLDRPRAHEAQTSREV